MTEYDLFGYLILSIYFGFVVILGIMSFVIIYVQKINKALTKLKKEMYISIEKEVVELKMDLLMVIESELTKLKKGMSTEVEKNLNELKKELAVEIEKKLMKHKKDTTLGAEKELSELNKNISDGITAIVETVERIALEKTETFQGKSQEKLTQRG